MNGSSERERSAINRQWMLAASGGAVIVAIIAIAGVASLWDSEPELEARPTGPPPPREYGGPLWFTVGGATDTQLVTNTLPRGVAGPGEVTTVTARYLADDKCFTDGTRLLIWPRGSRPITGSTPGVNPGDGVDILDGDTLKANAEELLIADAEDFPEVPAACSTSGKALSLSAVQKG